MAVVITPTGNQVNQYGDEIDGADDGIATITSGGGTTTITSTSATVHPGYTDTLNIVSVGSTVTVTRTVA